MNDEHNAKVRALRLKEQIAPIVEGLRKAGLSQEFLGSLEKGMDELGCLELRLTVAGAFNRGKSTTLNAIAGESIFLTDVLPSTNTVTELRKAETATLQVFGKSGECIENHPKISLSQIQERMREPATMVEGERRDVSKICCTLPSQRLKEGMVLIDTPGIDSLTTSHEDTARQAIDSSDAVLFVTAIDPITSASELDFFQSRISQRERTLVVLNKIDIDPVGYDASEVQKSVAYISRQLGIAPDRIVPLSSRDAMEAKDEAAYQRSGLVELLEKIDTHMVAGGVLLAKLKGIIDLLVKEVDHIEAACNQNLNSPTPPSLEPLAQSVDKLKVSKSEQQRELGNEHGRMLYNLSESVRAKQNEALRLQDWAEENLAAAASTEEIRRILEQFEGALNGIGEALNNYARAAFNSFYGSTIFLQNRLDKSFIQDNHHSGLRNLLSALGYGAAAAAAFAAVASTTSTTLLGSTVLGSLAFRVGFGALTKTTTVLPSLLAITGIGLLVAVPLGILGYCVAKSKALASAKNKSCDLVATAVHEFCGKLAAYESGLKASLNQASIALSNDFDSKIAALESTLQATRQKIAQDESRKLALFLSEIQKLREIVGSAGTDNQSSRMRS